MVHFQEAPKAVSDIEEMSGVGVEDEGDINPRNIDINSTAEKETKDMAGSQNCSMSGEEKS